MQIRERSETGDDMFFSQEQRDYFESIGFESIRNDAYMMSFKDCGGSIIVETWKDGFNVMVDTIFGVDSCVFNANNLKKAVRSALRRYKYKAKDVQRMVEHIDEIYGKTEGIPNGGGNASKKN